MPVCFNTAECIIPTRRISSADLDAPRIQRKEGERKCTWRTFYVLRAPPQLRPCSRGWVGCRRPSSVSVTRHRNGGGRSQGKKGIFFFLQTMLAVLPSPFLPRRPFLLLLLPGPPTLPLRPPACNLLCRIAVAISLRRETSVQCMRAATWYVKCGLLHFALRLRNGLFFPPKSVFAD